MRISRMVGYLLCLMIAFILLPLSSSGEAGHDDTIVYYIPVEQTVERGLEAFLKRGFETAKEQGADHIVLEIHTPGGAVDAANNIARLMSESDIPITAFVNRDAISAGAFIALNADDIVMTPSANMGAAGIIDGAGNAADQKAQSYWLNRMQVAAEQNGREPLYALAMADSSIDLPEYNAPEGTFLTLNAQDALEVGYAEAIAENRQELLTYLGIEDAIEVEMTVSLAEQIARFVTNPIVISVLITIGSLGLMIELFSPGFGVPGILGISSLLLFFFGHMIAGFAGMESILLFGLGIILICIEIFFSGFGIFALLGIGSIVTSFLLASYSTVYMVSSIAIAIVITGIVAIVMFRYFGNVGPWKKMVLQETFSIEEGYISNRSRDDLIGEIGESLTTLRPGGSALIKDEYLDVVTEGRYIEQGRKIKVVKATGSHIVVRELNSNH
ncbi:NfeD family protein [Alkalihalobacillus trypoxylicola]|uniref:Uncharacterized protein n=1 Tax=Alkalihalobacillus trypoxylicola TaxID=519424 RepID=A0A162E8G7_9BACI|nr:nodulation protein NfeD [Alkalihalobacillus trypoxylicola]KYG32030.1 hypothetical protein AZF04_04450 [Alkalihalobacillus trypoxylicola]